MLLLTCQLFKQKISYDKATFDKCMLSQSPIWTYLHGISEMKLGYRLECLKAITNCKKTWADSAIYLAWVIGIFRSLQELFPCHPYKLWVNKASKIVKRNCNENFEEGRGGIPCNSVSDGHFFFQQKCVKLFAISCSALVSRGLWLAVVC